MEPPTECDGDERRKLFVVISQISSCQVAARMVSVLGKIGLMGLRDFSGFRLTDGKAFKEMISDIMVKKRIGGVVSGKRGSRPGIYHLCTTEMYCACEFRETFD